VATKLSALAFAGSSWTLGPDSNQKSKRSGNFRLCLEALEQAAKERGGAYTSRRDVLMSRDPAGASEDQLQRIAAGEDPRKVLSGR